MGVFRFVASTARERHREVAIPVTLSLRKDSEQFLISRRKYVFACKH